MAADPRILSLSSFSASLSAFLQDHFKRVMDQASKNTHADAAPLVDAALSLLSRAGIDRDAVLGFFTSQAEQLLSAANQICEEFEAGGKILTYQVLVADARYIALSPPASTFYDVLTNKDTAIGPSYLPMETVAYRLGAVYAYILKQRNKSRNKVPTS